MMTLILIIIFFIIAVAMIIAIIKFQNLVNETKSKADAMSEEEKMTYSPYAQEDNSENLDNDASID